MGLGSEVGLVAGYVARRSIAPAPEQILEGRSERSVGPAFTSGYDEHVLEPPDRRASYPPLRRFADRPRAPSDPRLRPLRRRDPMADGRAVRRWQHESTHSTLPRRLEAERLTPPVRRARGVQRPGWIRSGGRARLRLRLPGMRQHLDSEVDGNAQRGGEAEHVDDHDGRQGSMGMVGDRRELPTEPTGSSSGDSPTAPGPTGRPTRVRRTPPRRQHRSHRRRAWSAPSGRPTPRQVGVRRARSARCSGSSTRPGRGRRMRRKRSRRR